MVKNLVNTKIRLNFATYLARPKWLAAIGGLGALALLLAACGSSDDTAPAAASVPTVAPTSAPATAVPEPTVTPTPKPEYVPGPRDAYFADEKIKIAFLYRLDPELAEAIDVVDVESIIRPTLERVGSDLLALPTGLRERTILFKGTDVRKLTATMAAMLDREGYYFWFLRDELLLNPNGSIGMEDLWKDIVPLELVKDIYTSERFWVDNGIHGQSLLDVFIMNGLAMAYAQEVFPDYERRLRDQRPEYASVIFDITAEAERDVWASARPDLDTPILGVAVDRYFVFYGGLTGEYPIGIGDAIGLRIVDAYLENNPDATALSLMSVTSEEILEGANYNP